jgi:hypothetical protein
VRDQEEVRGLVQEGQGPDLPDLREEEQVKDFDRYEGLLFNHPVMIGATVLVLLTIAVVAKRYLTSRRSRADEILGNLFMIIGLAWSSDAMWRIARGPAQLSLSLTALIFFVFEIALVLSMMRARVHLATYGWPGRPGKTAWGLAALMSVVAVAASHSMPEAVVRAAVPVVVVKLWWDGLIGGAIKRPAFISSWRWTPRRLLLAVGAIEPGERDVQTVHRERLTEQMTKLEFRRRYGSKRLVERRAARLARLSLKADDQIIKQVRQRVGRASWFTVTPLADAPMTQPGDAAPSKVQVPMARRTKDPVTSNDARDAGAKTRAVALVLTQGYSNRQAAKETGLSEATVRRALPDDAPSTQPINGHRPELEMSSN